MEFFGKDIEIDLTDNQKKITEYIGVALICLTLTILLIINPLREIKRNKGLLKKEKAKNLKVTRVLKETKERYKLQVLKYEEQKENYSKLQLQMENASIQNNAVLKEVIQKIADHLDVDLLTIGALQETPEVVDGSYKKKFIPYSMRGSGEDISTFFYFLENSNWLLTLKGSPVNIKRNSGEEAKDIFIRYKLGAYYPVEVEEVEDETTTK